MTESFDTVCMRPDSDVSWRIGPKARDELVKTHERIDKVVKEEQDPDILELEYSEYAMYAERLGFLHPGSAQHLIDSVYYDDAPILRAKLHRLNCTMLRLISHMPLCYAPCCCHCPARYSDLVCVVTGDLPNAHQEE